jgi:hypothetical protein
MVFSIPLSLHFSNFTLPSLILISQYTSSTWLPLLQLLARTAEVAAAAIIPRHYLLQSLPNAFRELWHTSCSS